MKKERKHTRYAAVALLAAISLTACAPSHHATKITTKSVVQEQEETEKKVTPASIIRQFQQTIAPGLYVQWHVKKAFGFNSK